MSADRDRTAARAAIVDAFRVIGDCLEVLLDATEPASPIPPCLDCGHRASSHLDPVTRTAGLCLDDGLGMGCACARYRLYPDHLTSPRSAPVEAPTGHSEDVGGRDAPVPEHQHAGCPTDCDAGDWEKYAALREIVSRPGPRPGPMTMVTAAAESLLNRLDDITTQDFAHGRERAEREALRWALDNAEKAWKAGR